MYKTKISSRVFLQPRNSVYCCEERWLSIMQIAVQKYSLEWVFRIFDQQCVQQWRADSYRTCKKYIKEAAAIPLHHERSSPIAAVTMASVGYLATNTQMNVRDITKTVSRDRQIKRLLNALYLRTYTTHRLTEHIRTIHILCIPTVHVYSNWTYTAPIDGRCHCNIRVCIYSVIGSRRWRYRDRAKDHHY